MDFASPGTHSNNHQPEHDQKGIKTGIEETVALFTSQLYPDPHSKPMALHQSLIHRSQD